MQKFMMVMLAAGGLMLAGCEGETGPAGESGPAGATGSDGSDGSNGSNGANGSDGVDGADGYNGTNGSNGNDGTTGADGTDGANGTDGNNGTDGTNGTSGTDGSNGTDGVNAGDFLFIADDASYTQIDRMGMPAVNTAVIASKDAYNEGNPEDDAAGTYIPEILASIAFLHGALDDDLNGAGLTPCNVIGDGTGSCAVVAAPLVVPDVLKLNLSDFGSFPNGRKLNDKAVDVTLAVVLLEIEDGTHTPFDLEGLSQGDNDGILLSGFPYLGAPF